MHLMGVNQLNYSQNSLTFKKYSVNASDFRYINKKYYSFHNAIVEIDGGNHKIPKISLSLEKEQYTLLLNFETKELVLSKSGNIIFSNLDIELNKIDEETKVILSFLLVNYIEATNKSLPRIQSSKFKLSSDCRLSSFGVSLTKGDAQEQAKSDRPDSSCSKSGEPGCLCATGVWGGDIACVCIQVWVCNDPVACLNVG